MSTYCKINLVLIIMILSALGIFAKPIIKHLNDQRSRLEEKSKAVALGYFLPDLSRLAEAIRSDEAGPVSEPQRYLEYYRKAQEIFPHLVNTPAFLGYFYGQSASWDKALAEYEKALEVNPYFFWHYYNLALVYHRLGRYEDSNRTIAKALEQKPEVAMVVINKSPEFRQIWRYLDEPQQVISQHITRGYQDSLALMALNYYALGEFEQVLGISSRALKLGLPQKDIHLYYAGVASQKLGQSETAFMLLQDFIGLHGNVLHAWQYLAEALEAAGKSDLAQKARQRANDLKLLGSDSQEPQFNLPLRIF